MWELRIAERMHRDVELITKSILLLLTSFAKHAKHAKHINCWSFEHFKEVCFRTWLAVGLKYRLWHDSKEKELSDRLSDNMRFHAPHVFLIAPHCLIVWLVQVGAHILWPYAACTKLGSECGVGKLWIESADRWYFILIPDISAALSWFWWFWFLLASFSPWSSQGRNGLLLQPPREIHLTEHPAQRISLDLNTRNKRQKKRSLSEGNDCSFVPNS